MTFNNKGLMSSNSIEWATPQYIVDWAQNNFFTTGHIFSLDVASTKQNRKGASYYTQEDDGLKKPWFGHVWLNPPYGRTISHWTERAISQINNTCSITLLLPARTDTKWWFNLIQNDYEKHIIFIKGRIKFNNLNPAPFPSVIVHILPRSGKTHTTYQTISKVVE